MNEKYSTIDYSDIPPITDFSRARKNHHAAKIKEHGYSVTIHYSPEDVVQGNIDDEKDIVVALVELMTKEETMRLLRHIKDNYNLPCSPDLWDVVN